jgi:hypothetical protein
MLNTLNVIDTTGDTELSWNPNNADEVEMIRKTFNKYKRKNYLAYKAKKGGKKGKLINEFDPQAGKIIMVPPIVGG